ncbi:MAG TPA: hypothetical protein VGR31_04050 [Planctomycetota bacterium]|jgi:hypothetical protein|nr:hypothetical protein [Planctomycetota bacterium]
MAPSPKTDRGAAVFVFAVWAGMLFWALLFVRAFAPRFPFGDEFALWDLLPRSGNLSLESLWRLKNEHRIPLPRLVQYLPYALTGDLRAPMVAQVFLLAALALLLILVARWMRGRTAWSDSFFPLVWLHAGNWANLLSGFQIALTLPTALATTILALLAVSRERVDGRRAAAVGACLACLPMCGAVGLVQAPALAACIAWLAISGRRSAGGRVLLASVGVCAAFCALYVLGYRAPHWYHESTRPWAVLDVVAKLLALSIGPAAESWWPASGAFVLAVIASTLFLVARARDGSRRLAFLASLAGIACLAVSIGVGRADVGPNQGFLARYVTLTTPLLCTGYLAWTAYGRGRSTALACGALALVAWVALPWNTHAGVDHGRGMREDVERFERVVAAGAGPAELVASFDELFPFHYPEASRWVVRTLALRRDPPFENARSFEPSEFDYLTFSRPPSRVESAEPVVARFVDGHHVVMAPIGASLRFDVAPGDARISGRFGVPSELAAKKSGGVRVLVEAVPREGPPRTLFDRTLDPMSVESDRGSLAFAIDGAELPPGEIVFRTEILRPVRPMWSWSYWSDVRIER